LFFGKNKKYKESVFLHELDHCACAPTSLKEKYYKYRSGINKKHKILNKVIPNFIFDEIFLKIHYEGPISGIANIERKRGDKIQRFYYGTNIAIYINEGITSLKQKIYSQKLNIKFHEKNDFQYGARNAAECIANVIGFENMLYFHFYNDFNKIEK